MPTKIWGLLGLVALSGCSDTAAVTQQPTAAAGGPTNAGAPSTVAQPNAGASAVSPATPAAPSGGAAGQPSQPSAPTSAGQAAPTPPTSPTSPTSPDGADAGTEPTPTQPNPSGSFDYPSGEVALDADLVIPAGKTVRVGPGTRFKAASGIKVQVLGELIAQGSPESPAAFGGGDVPRSWHGIVVESGGKLSLENAHISGATYGLFVNPGAEFSVDASVIDTSFKAAVVQSNGSFTRTRFVATVPETVSLASEVSVDDPNGALTIMDASPTITDCRFDGASTVTDLVRIGGIAAPTFDHVYLHDAHCAFHTFGGTNTSARISHARIENFAYGFMAYTTKPIVEDSVFMNNGADFGICLGATADNAPGLRNNFYSGGEVLLDASCFGLGIADPSPASSADPSIGTLTTF